MLLTSCPQLDIFAQILTHWAGGYENHATDPHHGWWAHELWVSYQTVVVKNSQWETLTSKHESSTRSVVFGVGDFCWNLRKCNQRRCVEAKWTWSGLAKIAKKTPTKPQMKHEWVQTSQSTNTAKLRERCIKNSELYIMRNPTVLSERTRCLPWSEIDIWQMTRKGTTTQSRVCQTIWPHLGSGGVRAAVRLSDGDL